MLEEKKISLNVNWIKGHAGHRWNERADVLAKTGVDSQIRADMYAKAKRLMTGFN